VKNERQKNVELKIQFDDISKFWRKKRWWQISKIIIFYSKKNNGRVRKYFMVLSKKNYQTRKFIHRLGLVMSNY
jgi:hypothetical protein